MPEISPTRWVTHLGWDDVPHLDAKTKRELLADTPPHLRDARSRGIATMGIGAIYPLLPERYTYEPFPIPAFWPRVYALDVGWKRTACVWAAWDRSVDVVYLYSEHYEGQQLPAVHAAAIKARGPWIPGVIDPASRGRSQRDGEQLIADYRSQGLILTPANNAVEAGIYTVWQRLETGRLKVSARMPNWFREVSNYHREEDGKIHKADDHLMDATRYLIMSGLAIAKVQPMDKAELGRGAHVVADSTLGY